MVEVVAASTLALSSGELAELRSLLDVAFDGAFDDDDWEHTVGGVHLVAREDDVVIAHASVVSRRLVAGPRELSTGYVEGVATRPDARRRGHASRVLRAAASVIAEGYELGALSATVPDLYARLGWERWRGPTYVGVPGGRLRTAEDDDGVMVLRTAHTPDLDVTADLTCDWRRGDVW